jgi:Domain of unknown function (DUF5658)
MRARSALVVANRFLCWETIRKPEVSGPSKYGNTQLLVYQLFLLNIVLQLFDGVATYGGLHLGAREANPLLRQTFAVWGIGIGVALSKGLATVLLVLIYRLAAVQVATCALAVSAACYSVCSLFPWLFVLAVILRSLL